MYKKLPVFILTVLTFFSLLVRPAFSDTPVRRYHLHFTWQQIFNNEFASISGMPPISAKIIASQVATPAIPLIPTNAQSQQNFSRQISTVSTTSGSPSLSDVQTFIMQAINEYRKSQGLGAVQTNTATCNFAKIRVGEITANFSHDGFNSRISNHTLPYSSYTKITENLAETSDYKSVVTMWANSPGHAENMRADTPYVCVVNNGNYYAYEGLKP